MRIKLTVAYDGTAYSGFQSQSNAPAVQDVLNGALADLFGAPVKTIGASRTDAGVHARGNVVIFDRETRIAPHRIAFALNTRLPEDIRIVGSEETEPDFHPLRIKGRKTYAYRILNRTFPDPVQRLYTFHYYYPLDAEKMNEAAGALIGEHDFASFCSAGFTGKTTVRTLFRSEVIREDDLITYWVEGNGFLYNMVRIIAGTLIRIGSGSLPPSSIEEILLARDRAAAADTAPAKGLTLEKIAY